jgi:hypothetical protein
MFILNHLDQKIGFDSSFSHVITLLNSFHHQGRNGTRLCLMLETMNASVAAMIEELPQNKFKRFEQIARYSK